MKYYILAGEASGDLHASNLMKAIKTQDPEAEFRAWGGDLMQQQGATLVKHINELAFMGFLEVALNIRTILHNIKLCKSDILAYQPDAIIFIDYPGFNLRIAEFAKKNNFRTIYYISPQVWAWHKSRVQKIRRDIDKMLVILPFEEEFYARYNYPVEFVGHPLLDALQGHDSQQQASAFRQRHALSQAPIIALLPGSRKQEIAKMLKTMSEVSEHFPGYQFVIAATRAHTEEFYRKHTSGRPIRILFGETYNLLQNAHAAMVTSGTATLETALIGTPQLVCYKAAFLSYFIAKRLVDIKYISLVNLIMDQEIVKELIQHEFNTTRLVKELKNLTENSEYRKSIIDNYTTLRQKLGGSGASENAAKAITRFLKS